jgi:hypothetical protein
LRWSALSNFGETELITGSESGRVSPVGASGLDSGEVRIAHNGSNEDHPDSKYPGFSFDVK